MRMSWSKGQLLACSIQIFELKKIISFFNSEILIELTKVVFEPIYSHLCVSVMAMHVKLITHFVQFNLVLAMCSDRK